jgi:hypothetical protein
VANFGIGCDYRSGEKSLISGSFVTDFTASKPGSETNLTLSRGIFITFPAAPRSSEKSRGHAGPGLFFWQRNRPALVRPSNPDEESLTVAVVDTELRIRRIKFLFGFNF